MKSMTMQRRQFIKSSVAAAAGMLILPSGTRAGADAPSNKLNIALIGAWGRAKAHYPGLKKENVVAICDVDEDHLALAAQEFPGARKYVDWRRCLEQKDIDAVVCCTPDHMHAFIACWALNREKHLYLEKPIGITVHEARTVREKYLTKRHRLACQIGTQRHAKSNFARVRELIRDGAIGELKDVHAWGNRQLRRPGYLPAEGEPPASLHYDLWLGASPYHPYNPGYFTGDRPGSNCLQWNMYWDFGTGQIGDMGSHTMDLAWNALDAELPTTAEASGEPFNPEVTPVELVTRFDIPANDWRPAVRVAWHQGGAMPESPRDYIDLNQIAHGALFKGEKGFLVADFDTRVIIPYGDDADLTYYQPRSEEDITPPADHFQAEWINACKGDLKTSCDFDYNGRMMEMMNLGLAAYRAGVKLDYDGASGKVTNITEANDYLTKPYREGWVMDG